MLSKGDRFRRDLYYRLAGFSIQIPPLRERREDIDVLAHHFLKKSAADAQKSIRAISADALHDVDTAGLPRQRA